MARATVTIRELKNKDTGIDLSVTSYKETKGMLGSNYEYQIMVVSNLSNFKTAKHKDTDNVQFTVLRKMTEFEELYNKMNIKYSGTIFPQLPKKVLMMNESVAKERRNSLDHFVKFLAMTPKLCSCSLLMEFLGVSAMKSGKFRKMEVSDSIVGQQLVSQEERKEKSADAEEDDTKENTNTNLFDDDDDAEEDEDEDLFSSGNLGTEMADETKMFDGPDLGGALEEGEAEDLFIVDAKPSPTNQVSSRPDEEEDDDLFRIDDDLDKIMQLDLKMDDKSTETKTSTGNKKTAEITSPVMVTETKPEIDYSENEQDVKITSADKITETKTERDTDPTVEVTSPGKPKPSLRPKPALRSKPVIPKRTDQSKPSNETVDSSLVKLNSNENQHVQKPIQAPRTSPRQKPPLTQKPQLAKKPDIKPKPSAVKDTSMADGKSEDSQSKGDNLVADKGDNTVDSITSEDDIMKYIQANAANDDDDLDLFS